MAVSLHVMLSIDFLALCNDDMEMKLAVFVSDKVPEIVIGDPGRFRQIITNLVGNSVKVSGLFKFLSDWCCPFFFL